MRLILSLLATLVFALPAAAKEMHPHGPEGGWKHKGVFGSYDRGALQRGLLVYKQVCAACHALNLVAYRNLAMLGYSEDEIKTIAAEKRVKDGPNDQGEMFDRPARPSDPFVAPFANDQAARVANGGALPPDLSLIIKARHGGENYVYSLLTGFGETPPADMKILPGMNYNPYFPGGQIAMPPPLAADDLVSYSDGTKATKEQMAKDVVQFLAWAAEPHMEQRKRIGIRVMLFLLVLTGVFYAAKRQLWRDVH
ncbi:MAG: cytochrome c1 [Proteobacteria bacterium]|nr:cytochrome c1 [Pseudomonadota bacterium]